MRSRQRVRLFTASALTVAAVGLGLAVPSMSAWAEMDSDNTTPIANSVTEVQEPNSTDGSQAATGTDQSDSSTASGSDLTNSDNLGVNSDADSQEAQNKEAPQLDASELDTSADIAAEFGTFALPDGAEIRTIPAGAIIVDFGGNGTFGKSTVNQLRPFGFVQDLLLNYQIPLLWAIADGKTADTNIDFTVTTERIKPAGTTASRNYSTGAFIIMPQYVPFIQAALDKWGAGLDNKGKPIDGVVFDRATQPFTAPVFGEVQSWPRTVLDFQNGHIAGGFYTSAGINFNTKGTKPELIDYRMPYFKGPSELTSCDDLYVMPHADPVVSTHSNLLDFNESGGYIWAGCHAVSALENMSGTVSNVNYPLGSFSFLSTDGLVHWKTPGHADGTPPYETTTQRSDPIMQFWGVTDQSSQNGSEQIYLPSLQSAWRNSTRILSWDPDQKNVLPGKDKLSNGPASSMLYGRGFGDPTNGMVMYQGGHDISKDGNTADSISAQRAFFNFNLLNGIDSAPKVKASADKTEVTAGGQVQLTAAASGGTPPYRYEWTSSCGGTFSNATAANPIFTAPNSTETTNCLLKVQIRDDCDRFAVDAVPLTVKPVPTTLIATKSVNVGDTTPVMAGQTITYTLTFQKTGNAAFNLNYTDNLAGVKDDAVINQSTLNVTHTGQGHGVTAQWTTDGNLQVSGGIQHASTLITVTFTVTVKPDGERGDSQLGNFLVPTGQTPPTECPPTSALCTTNPVSSWTMAKTADPVTGSDVSPGDEITYTVRASSVKGAISDAIITDDMSEVLNNATFVTGSAEVSINGGTAVPIADPIGTTLVSDPLYIPTNGFAELSYRVTVNAGVKFETLTNSAHGIATHTVKPSDPNSPTLPFPPMECTVANPCSTSHDVFGGIFIEKWGTPAGAEAAGPIDGAEFEVRTDNNGSPADADPISPIVITPVPGEVGRFSTSALLPGATYWLIETRAPAGHSLLAQPVAFSINQSGEVTITQSVINPQATVVGDAKDTIRVSDVAAIQLPLSGGLGVNLLVFGSLLAVTAGAVIWLIRRQTLIPEPSSTQTTSSTS